MYTAVMIYTAPCPACGEMVQWRQILDLRGSDTYSLEGCECPATWRSA
jgi:predicted RNA-binding Zn-ribbon protein involved in translation (DUF1610 family)